MFESGPICAESRSRWDAQCSLGFFNSAVNFFFFFLIWLCAVNCHTFYDKKAISEHGGSDSLMPLSSTS